LKSLLSEVRWLEVSLGAFILAAVLCAGAYASAAPETINEAKFCLERFFSHLRAEVAQ